ncbi:MAG: aminotransferase class V-fold PLP-dependent enzyme [Candidatus Woesearchaeota archaeon]
MSKKYNLLLAGPVNVSQKVKEALQYPEIGHREEEFQILYSSIRKQLLKVFRANHKEHHIVVISGSGTAAMESVISSLKKTSILFLTNGTFGDRLRDLGKLHGHNVIEYNAGVESLNLVEIERILNNNKTIRYISIVHCETSTGRLNPIDRIKQLAQKYKKKLIIDAMSSLGAEKFTMAGVDICFSNTNKSIEGVPVLSFVCTRKDAMNELREIGRCFYLDLRRYIGYSEKNQTPYTPAIPLFFSLSQSLDEILREGVSNRILRYKKRTAYFKNNLLKLGLNIRVKEKQEQSNVCSFFSFPPHTNPKNLFKFLRTHGFIIYPSRYSKLEAQISWLASTPKKEIDRFISLLKEFLKRS